MSNIPQLRQAVKLMLDVMPNSPIFSAIQVNDLIADLEGTNNKPQALESSNTDLVAGVVLTQEQVDSMRRLNDRAEQQAFNLWWNGIGFPEALKPALSLAWKARAKLDKEPLE